MTVREKKLLWQFMKSVSGTSTWYAPPSYHIQAIHGGWRDPAPVEYCLTWRNRRGEYMRGGIFPTVALAKARAEGIEETYPS